MKLPQLSVFLENRPGSLMEPLKTLAAADKAYTDGIQQFRSIAKSIGLQAQ